MSAAYLGDVFDIHGGGLDLIFPHHENEIAQSRCAHGTHAMANYWLHNGFLQVEGEKMSKSLGNFVTINELLATEKFGGRKWPGVVLRLAMLLTHYRQPINWTAERLNEAQSECLKLFPLVHGLNSEGEPSAEMVSALCDDLNTSEAMRIVRSLAKDAVRDGGKKKTLAASLALLGLDFDIRKLTPFRVFNSADPNSRMPETVPRIRELIEMRTAARARKDFKESDRIRDELAAMGVAIKDGKDADGKPVTTWEIAR
jgi:cysteinyl-tRNA synthetase